MRRAAVSAPIAGFLLAPFVMPASAARRYQVDEAGPDGQQRAVLLVSEQHQPPMVTLAIGFDAGARRDPKGKEGLAALTASFLTLGTGQLSAEEFSQKVNFMGSSLTISSGMDYSEATFGSPKKYEDQTLAQAPSLRDEDILRKRSGASGRNRRSAAAQVYRERDFLLSPLFGDTPYSHMVNGSTESLTHLTPADVRDFYRTHYNTANAFSSFALIPLAESREADSSRMAERGTPSICTISLI